MRQPLGTKLYYSIGEVAEITELQPYTLRAWEKEFPCLRPRRVRGKNRAYRERDIAVIFLIKRLLYEERYSTRGVYLKLKSEPDLLRMATAGPVDGRWPGSESGGPNDAARATAAAGGRPGVQPAHEATAPAPHPAGAPLPVLIQEVCRDLREVIKTLS